MIVSNHSNVCYSYFLVTIEAGDMRSGLQNCFVSCVQWFQLQLIQVQRKLPSEPKKACILKTEKTCALAMEHQMMFSLLKVVIAVQYSVLPFRETDLRGHHLGVGVATAHSLVTLKMAVQTQFPKLAHSDTSMWVDLPMNNKGNLKVGCVWNHRT